MSTQASFTPEEWKTLTLAPMIAGAYVATSDIGGLISLIKEATAVSRTIITAGQASQNELVKSIAAWWAHPTERPQPPDMAAAKDNRALMLEPLKQALAIVEAKDGASLADYKAFCQEAGRQAALASKEGGFLGFGGVQESEKEKQSQAELAAALGVTA